MPGCRRHAGPFTVSFRTFGPCITHEQPRLEQPAGQGMARAPVTGEKVR